MGWTRGTAAGPLARAARLLTLAAVVSACVGFPLPGGSAPGDADALATALSGVRVAAGGPALTADPRLSAVAARACEPSPGGGLAIPDGQEFAVLRIALWERGVHDFDFTWRRVVFRGEADLAALARELGTAAGIEGYNFVGAAVDSGAGGPRCAAAVFARRFAFPIGPAGGTREGSGGRLRFTLARGYDRPRILVTAPDGSVLSGRVSPEGGGYLAEYPITDSQAVHRVELVAEGKEGTAVALLFPVGTAAATPEPSMEDGALVSAPAAAEGQFLTWINAERRAHGLSEVTPAVVLAETARRHSDAMARRRFFGHDDPDGRSLVHRLDAAGVLYSVATENVGRATSPQLAHACFMASPGHRANVLDARVTHVGIGVARDGDAWFVTQDYARLLPATETPALRAESLSALAGIRASAGLPPLTERRLLSDIAQGLAERAAKEGRAALPPPEDGRTLGERVRFGIPGVGRIAADLIVSDRLDTLKSSGHLLDGGFSMVGLGLARGPGPADPEGHRVGEGMLWVVVLLAAAGS